MNEEKIGIITLNGYRNYGNILQNLALQKALDKLNIASETIWYERGDHTTFVSKVSTHIRDRDLLKSLNYQFGRLWFFSICKGYLWPFLRLF